MINDTVQTWISRKKASLMRLRELTTKRKIKRSKSTLFVYSKYLLFTPATSVHYFRIHRKPITEYKSAVVRLWHFNNFLTRTVKDKKYGIIFKRLFEKQNTFVHWDPILVQSKLQLLKVLWPVRGLTLWEIRLAGRTVNSLLLFDEATKRFSVRRVSWHALLYWYNSSWHSALLHTR